MITLETCRDDIAEEKFWLNLEKASHSVTKGNSLGLTRVRTPLTELDIVEYKVKQGNIDFILSHRLSSVGCILLNAVFVEWHLSKIFRRLDSWRPSSILKSNLIRKL